MDFDLEGGKYIVAVSGGVDSVALLHALLEKQHSLERKANTKNENNSSDTEVKTPSKGSTLRRTLRRGLTRREIGGGDEYEFVVAHFDHGIRSDSAQDRRFGQPARHCCGFGVCRAFGDEAGGNHPPQTPGNAGQRNCGQRKRGNSIFGQRSSMTVSPCVRA